MKVIIPRNIFAGFAVYLFGNKVLENLETLPSSLISNALLKGEADVALIPSLDLLTHRDFFISSKTGIAFDGELCVSYLYFVKGEKNITKLSLNGDVTTNETFVAKLIFEEFYDTKIELSIDLGEPNLSKSNYLISGNKNFEEQYFQKGISLAEQLSEFLDYPYFNFVYASLSKEKLEEFNALSENIDSQIEDSIDALLENLKILNEAKSFIKKNLNSVYFEITQNEKDGLSKLLEYAYYKGMIDDIIELKWV